MIKEQIQAKIQVPKVPNFILEEQGIHKFPLSSFSKAALRRIGELWTEALVQRAEEQRKEQNG